MKKLLIIASVLLFATQAIAAKPRLRGPSSPNRTVRSNRITVICGNRQRHVRPRNLHQSHRRPYLNRRCQTRSYVQQRYNRRPRRVYVQTYRIQYNIHRPRISRYGSGASGTFIPYRSGRKTTISGTNDAIPLGNTSRIKILAECRSKVGR
jgi:hypothetical protein